MSSTPPPDSGAANAPQRIPGEAGGAQPGGEELWQRPEGWRPPERAEVPRRKIGRSVWVFAGLAVLLVVALVTWRLWPSSEEEVQAAAQEFVNAAVDGDCARAREFSTGTVNDQVGNLCNEPLGSLVGDAEPTVEVNEVDGDQATATASLSIAAFTLQLEMAMLNEDGQWLVSEVTLPGGLPEELLGSITP